MLTRQELGTLAAREAAEVAAYKAFSASKTTTHLTHLGALARAELAVAADQALNRSPGGHPGIAASLRGYLTTVSNLSKGSVAAATGASGGAGGMTSAQLKYWLAAAQYGELLKYRGVGRTASRPARRNLPHRRPSTPSCTPSPPARPPRPPRTRPS